MNPVLEEILSCPNLPSLPAVALRVIELTSNVNVSLKELAETIQNDQGLATKILKTVNSSFYGLRQRCSTIDKAIVMLGLSPVKSLALGFSLVESIDDPADARFAQGTDRAGVEPKQTRKLRVGSFRSPTPGCRCHACRAMETPRRASHAREISRTPNRGTCILHQQCQVCRTGFDGSRHPHTR